MDNIGTMIVNNDSPDSIRDAIISALYTKAAERVEAAKPYVAANIFNDSVEDDSYEDEYEYDEEDDEEDGYDDEE